MGGFLVNQTQNLIIKKEMNLEDLQMLQALTAAAQLSSAQQHATQQQQAAAEFATEWHSRCPTTATAIFTNVYGCCCCCKCWRGFGSTISEQISTTFVGY